MWRDSSGRASASPLSPGSSSSAAPLRRSAASDGGAARRTSMRAVANGARRKALPHAINASPARRGRPAASPQPGAGGCGRVAATTGAPLSPRAPSLDDVAPSSAPSPSAGLVVAVTTRGSSDVGRSAHARLETFLTVKAAWAPLGGSVRQDSECCCEGGRRWRVLEGGAAASARKAPGRTTRAMRADAAGHQLGARKRRRVCRVGTVAGVTRAALGTAVDRGGSSDDPARFTR